MRRRLFLRMGAGAFACAMLELNLRWRAPEVPDLVEVQSTVLDDLLHMQETLASAGFGRGPHFAVMSPETWDRLKAEVGEPTLEDPEAGRWVAGCEVKLFPVDGVHYVPIEPDPFAMAMFGETLHVCSSAGPRLLPRPLQDRLSGNA